VLSSPHPRPYIVEVCNDPDADSRYHFLSSA
jgi:hypothetical protein